MRRMKNLSDALPELIGLIAERLESLEDCLRFGAVCKSWQSVIRDLLKCNVSPKTFPWIMFPRRSYQESEEESCDEAEESCNEHDDVTNEAEESCDEDDDVTNPHSFFRREQDFDIDLHSFFSLSADRYYELYLPEAFDCGHSGSPYGWIVLCKRPQMGMLNPVSHDCLPLPPLTTIGVYDDPSHYYFTKVKVTISPSSSGDRFIVFAIFQGTKPIFARPGDKSWAVIDMPVKNRFFSDIQLLNNQVYLVDDEGIATHFDMITQSPAETEYALGPGAIPIVVDGDDEYRYYLVDILSELYMVVKIECYDNYCSEIEGQEYAWENQFWYSFKVFKMDFGTGKWKEVFTLGDYAIFVGRTSFPLLVSEYPESRSCIYFTDHDFGERRRSGNAGRYNLETKQLGAMVFTGYVGKLNLPPFWFIPNFQKADQC